MSVCVVTRDLDRYLAEQDRLSARDDELERISVELYHAYSADPGRLVDAMEIATADMSDDELRQLFGLMKTDTAEFGRVLAAAIDEALADTADRDAEDELDRRAEQAQAEYDDHLADAAESRASESW